MKKAYLDKLLANRFRPKGRVRKIFEKQQKLQRSKPEPAFISGVYKGQFFRVPLPPPRRIPNLPKLPSTQKVPQAFKSVKKESKVQSLKDFKERAKEWISENAPVLIFNLGSICTLISFTRSDVLELRSLSVAGSLSFIVYNLFQQPRRLSPILWSLTFTGVNSVKIYDILTERHSVVYLNEEQEDVYVRHFLPHGITPKQFESIFEKAKKIKVPQGECIIRQGEKLDHVYLVAEGATRASILGRHLTAASTSPTAHEEHVGGASGAWVGEMAFLECFWVREQGKISAEEKKPEATENGESKEKAKPVAEDAQRKRTERSRHVQTDDDSQDTTPAIKNKESTTEPPPKKSQQQEEESKGKVKLKASRSMYTIVAKEDCTLLQWSHDDMEELMKRSTDLRAALTRAMTSAIVGKVINFTVSKSKNNLPAWSTWLDDWKHNGSARVEILEKEQVFEPPGLEPDLPTPKLKQFD